MEIILLEGASSWKRGKYHKGLTCVCEIQNGDEKKTKEIVESIVSRFRNIKIDNKELILIPVSCITGKNLKELDKAREYFMELQRALKKVILQYSVVAAPFDSTKEINLKLRGLWRTIHV
jgi:hypothetical protein